MTEKTHRKIGGFLEVGTNGAGEVVINHPDLKPDENGVGHIVFSPAQARDLARLLLGKIDEAERELSAKREAELSVELVSAAGINNLKLGPDIRREDAERSRRALDVLKQKSEQHGAAVCTTDGKPPDPDYDRLDDAPKPVNSATGQHGSYYVLCDEERAKGFVRPVRQRYQHVGARPKYPLRDLTVEEHTRYDQYHYAKFEEYPSSEAPKTGKFWTAEELKSGCGTVTTMGIALAETYARDPHFYGGTFCCGCGTHFPLDQFVWDGTNERVGS